MPDLLHLLDPSETIAALKEYRIPPYITLAHLFNAPEGWGLKPRVLTQHQIQYVADGTAEYSVEGKTFITKRGDLIFHAENVPHSVQTMKGEPYLCISIVFHFGSFRFNMDNLIPRSGYIGNIGGSVLETRLNQLITHYHQPGAQNQILCQGLLLQIIHDLHNWNDRSQTRIQEKTKTKIILIRNYIAKNYSRNIEHKELEEVSGLSRNYIIVKFRQTYGMTPFEYLTSVRIEKAKELVIQTNLSISEIARLIGYSDVHTFGRMFKSKAGVSLSQFCASLVAE
jgi:AraC-like DNA-binding protein